MLKVEPVDKKESDKLFSENGIKITKNSAAVEAKIDNMILGYCLFDYDDITAKLFYFDLIGDTPYLIEILMKAALNYCSNRGAYLAQCDNSLFFSDLIKLGFKKEEDCVTGEIPKLLIGSCHKQ